MSTTDWLLMTHMEVAEAAEELALQWLQAAQQGDSKRECARAEIAYKHARDAADRARIAAGWHKRERT